MTLHLVLALVVFAAPTDPITKKNWRSHPRIEAIRAKVAAIQKLQDDQQLKLESNPACEQPSDDIERDAYRDGKGRIRRYHSSGGSSDSAYDLTINYDENGQRIFAYATMGAVSDITVEFRIYFEHDKEIWRDKQTKGAGGWTFNPNFPDKYLHKDPAKALNAKKDCAEPL